MFVYKFSFNLFLQIQYRLDGSGRVRSIKRETEALKTTKGVAGLVSSSK